MNRFLIVAVTAAGACAVAFPAFAGLSGNPSFSHQVPVRVPSQAHVVHFDDHGHALSDDPTSASSTRVPSSARTSSASEPEPSDDRSARSTEAEPGDDHSSASTEPGEHSSGTEAEHSSSSTTVDDHGTDAPTQASSTTVDDHGSHGGGSHGGK